MPTELLNALSAMYRSLRTPAGVAGSGPIGRDERGRFTNQGQEMLAMSIDRLTKTLAGEGREGKLLSRRKGRIEIDTLSSRVSKIVETSNRLYALDKYMKEKGFTNKDAALRVMQLTDPKRLKSIEYKAKYGEDANRVLEAELSAGKVGSGLSAAISSITTATKAIGAFAAGFTTGLHAVTGFTKFLAEARHGMTKFTSQLYEMNRAFSIDEKVMSAFAATGMDALSASRATASLETWAAGLKYGVGFDKFKSLSMVRLDLNGIDPLTASAKDIMRVLAPQIQKMSASERAAAVAIGAISKEEMRGMMTYGKSFYDLTREEQLNIQDAAWQWKLNYMKMEAATLPPKKREVMLARIKALELEGPHAWQFHEEEYGQTAFEMEMAQASTNEMYKKSDKYISWKSRRDAAEQSFIADATKSNSAISAMAPMSGLSGWLLSLLGVPGTSNKGPKEEEVEKYMSWWERHNSPPGMETSLFPSGFGSGQRISNTTVDMSGATFNVTGDNATDISQDILSQVSDGIVVAIQNNEEK